MKITREKIVQGIVHNIEVICKECLSKPFNVTNDNNFIIPLTVTKIELTKIISKIITALPPDFFIGQPDNTARSIKEYITKEYILFQAQEDINSRDFADCLLNFIDDLIDNIDYCLEQENISLLGKL